jgi:hypothetical protein
MAKRLASGAIRQLVVAKVALAAHDEAAEARPLRSFLRDGKEGLASTDALVRKFENILAPIRDGLLAPLTAMAAMTGQDEEGYALMNVLYTYAAPPVSDTSHSFDIYLPLLLHGLQRLLQCGPTAAEHLSADFVASVALEFNLNIGDEANADPEKFRAGTRRLMPQLLREAQDVGDFRKTIAPEYVSCHHRHHHHTTTTPPHRHTATPPPPHCHTATPPHRPATLSARWRVCS